MMLQNVMFQPRFSLERELLDMANRKQPCQESVLNAEIVDND